MKSYKQYFFYGVHTLLLVFTITFLASCSPDKTVDTTKKQSLQDSHRAVTYFEQHLEFTTNSYAINSLLKSNSNNMLILDVRDEDSFHKGHIPTAVNIPFGENVLESKLLDNNKYTYVYCYDELCNLATRIAKDLAEAGYPVKVIRGGFAEWRNQDLPIESK